MDTTRFTFWQIKLPLPNEQTGRAIKPRLFTLLTGPDMMLFASILLTELGHRSSVRVRDLMGLELIEKNKSMVFPAPSQDSERQQQEPLHQQLVLANFTSRTTRKSQTRDAWLKLGENIYEKRSSNHKSNFIHIQRIFKETKELVSPLLELCPKFEALEGLSARSRAW